MEWERVAGNDTLFVLRVPARSWEELAPVFAAAWEKFLRELENGPPEEFWRILVTFGADSGKVTLGHAPADRYLLEGQVLAMCQVPWVEEAWYALDEDELGDEQFDVESTDLCLRFARAFLEAGRLEPAATAIRRVTRGRAILLQGEGRGMDPAPFEIDLAALLDGLPPTLVVGRGQV
jgi:hypothetical protein